MPLQRILINAANLIAAGPSAVGRSLLPSLVSALPEASFTVLLPEDWRARPLELPANAAPRYLPVKAGVWKDVESLKQLYFGLPRVANETRADVCLTLGDYPPVGLPCPHVVFLHNPLLVYSQAELQGSGDWPRARRIYLRAHFRLTAPSAEYIAVQTDVMARRVIATYGIDSRKVVIIPQPVPLHVSSVLGIDTPSQIRDHPKPVKLTFLAAYYAHKNHKILPAVASELRRRGLADKVQIFTTINLDSCPSASVRDCFRDNSDVLTNLGTIGREDVAALLADSSAFFLPTTVETFGLVYLEAMAFGLPILTSDRDFAHTMCGDLARYFDPFDAVSIADCIEEFCAWRKPGEYAAKAKEGLSRFPPNWDAVAEKFLDLLRKAADSSASQSATR